MYKIKIHSCENDGDVSRIFDYIANTKKEYNAIIHLCENLFKVNSDNEEGIGNLFDDDLSLDINILRYFKQHPTLIENIEIDTNPLFETDLDYIDDIFIEEHIDILIKIKEITNVYAKQIMGLSDCYAFRYVEKIETNDSDLSDEQMSKLYNTVKKPKNIKNLNIVNELMSIIYSSGGENEVKRIEKEFLDKIVNEKNKERKSAVLLTISNLFFATDENSKLLSLELDSILRNFLSNEDYKYYKKEIIEKFITLMFVPQLSNNLLNYTIEKNIFDFNDSVWSDDMIGSFIRRMNYLLESKVVILKDNTKTLFKSIVVEQHNGKYRAKILVEKNNMTITSSLKNIKWE